ncbi:MAG: sugar phosphate isomerase/epimerase, partial [Acidobacteria bacterium]|nr:sugar phosphate isomerase/epimerase [Acidobacteriota bacterium]
MNTPLSRRSLLMSAGALAALPAFAKKKPLLGIDMYSVRTEMAKNIFEPVKAVAKMGYECVEFYGPYINWTPDQVKEMRKLLDDLKLKCKSTHNDNRNLLPENIQKAIDINKALGSEYIVMASAGKVEPTVDGWKKVAGVLTKASELTKSAGLKVGYHNHGTEFKALDGTFPLEVIAKNTPQDVMLQLDIGTCVEAGRDPVAWI